MKKSLIIGNSTKVTIAGIQDIPAKIDTGAEYSSVWATNIHLNEQGKLAFHLLGPAHPLYTGKTVTVDDFYAVNIRNSTGYNYVRYLVQLPVKIKGRRIRASFSLADRSRNNFPVLIGRRLLKGKFLVDVSELEVPYPPRILDQKLNAELKSDPRSFHDKYMANPEQPETDHTPAN